jgi:hypothetical protein
MNLRSRGTARLSAEVIRSPAGWNSGILRIASLTSLLFLGLALGVSYSHLLQAGPKATLPAKDFLTIQQILLSRYGAGVGWVEGLAALSLGLVAFLGRGSRRYFSLAVTALACVVVMIAIWAIGINPINAEVKSWTPSSVPDEWRNARDSWHELHAIRFALAVVAISAFGWSVTGVMTGTCHEKCGPFD